MFTLNYATINHGGPLASQMQQIVMPEYGPPLATGDQPGQTEAHVSSIQCAEATGARAWLSDNR